MGIYGNSKETSGTDAKSEHTKVKMIIVTMIIVMIIMTIFLCISITACSMQDFFTRILFSSKATTHLLQRSVKVCKVSIGTWPLLCFFDSGWEKSLQLPREPESLTNDIVFNYCRFLVELRSPTLPESRDETNIYSGCKLNYIKRPQKREIKLKCRAVGIINQFGRVEDFNCNDFTEGKVVLKRLKHYTSFYSNLNKPPQMLKKLSNHLRSLGKSRALLWRQGNVLILSEKASQHCV